MSRYVSKELRDLVSKRARGVCEYCLITVEDSFFAFHIEHIISIKHGGETSSDNLAYSCAVCNREKGSDLGTFLDNRLELIRFYNPRFDKWSEHFKLEGSLIVPITKIGEATIKIFKLNSEHRLLERGLLIDLGAYPSKNAQLLITE